MAQTAPISMRVLASSLETSATIETASFRARTLDGTTELMHFIHFGLGPADFSGSAGVLVLSSDWSTSVVTVGVTTIAS